MCKQIFLAPEHNQRWAGSLCCSQLGCIWDLWCDHSHLQWVSIQHLLLPYWTVNISDQQPKSRCVCVMSSMHSTWNDLSLKTELWMHSRLQQYPEMFLLHSRAFVGEFSHLGPKSLTFQARGMCRWGLPPFSVQQLEGEDKPSSHSTPLFSPLLIWFLH